MRRYRLILAALWLAVQACAASAERPAGPDAVAVNDAVKVTFTEPQATVPFDPRAARLQEASAQLVRIAGHPVELRFDAALVPEWRASFQKGLEEGVENVARDLDDMQKREPRLFSFGAPRLKRVFCKYDAIARDSDATLDAKTGEVTITMPAQASELLPRGAVYSAIEDAFDAELDRRFGNVEPEQADDLDLYFDYLTSHHRREKSGDLGTQEGLKSDPRALGIDRVARLSARAATAKGDLTTRIDAWLLRSASYFVDAYERDAAEVERAPKDAAFHRAEASYVTWMNARADALGPADRRELLKATAVRSRDRREEGRTFTTSAFPGFDWLGHALAVVDAWIAAGHPIGTATPREQQDLFDAIVCPTEKDERGRRTASSRCDYELYEYAFATDAIARKRFLDALAAKKDVPFVESTFASLRHLRGEGWTGRTVVAWRAIDGDAASWNAAAAVVATEADSADKRVLVDELGREWRAHPERRGELLFLFTAVGRYGSDGVDWARFAEQSGAPITQAEYASFIGTSPLAISNARMVWPALGRGYSRVDAIVPRLDSYVEDPLVRQNDSSDPEGALHDIVRLSCADGQLADIAKLHAYFQSRIAFHAGDAKRFSGILDDTREGKCKPKPPPARPKPPKKDPTEHDPFAARPVTEDPGTPFGPPTTP